MNDLQIFVTGLVVMSAVVGLATEAVKLILDERSIKYYSNTLAGVVALILSSAAGVAYVVLTGATFTGSAIVGIITFVFMSWLCAMVGYDKVIQTIAQFKKDTD